ncbi:MAG TPA: ABC transporter substrate-binding protein [Gaiellaceae bacterium]|nr:ABC transporter substrate-binding protein [Gaiellaceae bacterium]
MAVATGERRIVSVLVADVVGSTAIGEALGPERSKFLIDEVMRVMAEQVRRYDGTVAQLVGDELLAVFGVPVAHEDDAERALRAALAIQRAIGQYAQEVKAAYGVELAVRIGVNTGPVVVAPERDGDDGYDRWNALGDTVNVASRFQEIAGRGGVVTGPTTKRQVETCFELEEMGSQDLKGVSAPLDTFRVTRVLESEPSPPTLPLVGRDFELTVLERTMDALVEGRGAIVSIVGEPGIGKTRLVWEARNRYREDVRFIEARGVSYAQSFPYWPIRDLLREWLGVGATTPEARVRLELKAELAHLFGQEEADESYPFFASLVGLTLEPEAAQSIRELNRESIQSRTFEVFHDLVCELAEELPLCLAFEDLHWADEATLELLESLLAVTEESAVALFFLYRPEREHGSWRLGERARQHYPHRYREIELRPLPPDSSRVLVGNAADGEIPESVVELLAERSGGNPFFLEEAFRDLVERGVLQRQNGGWKLAVSEDELSIPAVVQGTLQARLDRLDPETREALSLAAVIGRTFGLPLLERLVPRDRLLRALTELQRLDLIVEKRRRPNPEYRFRHGLVQEVAYASLVDSKRRKLHKQVGEALEEIYRESPEEAYGLLARHFTEADEPEKAVEYLLKAGDAARAVYADKEALEHYSRARVFLARLGDERRARDTLFKMALAYHLAFDFEKAEEMYDEAFCCRVGEDPRLPPTARLETASALPRELAPGDIYTTEAGYFSELLFRGLLMVDAELNVVPAMADNFRVSADGLSYLFRLGEDVRWSDGEPVTAEDFAYAWRRMRELETRTSFLMEDVETAEALDDRTLEVRLREPRSYFPYVLCSAWAFPWPRHRCEALGDDWAKPENLVGNGPFTLVEFDDEHALLRANEHWAGPRGNVGEIAFTFHSKGAEMIEAWQRGRFDLLHVHNPVPEDEPETLRDLVSELGLQYVGFRADRPPFSNELVRRAFSHAIDRELLVATSPALQLARAATRGGAIPPAMPAHSHRVGPEYDLETARALLDEAGHPGGKGLPEVEIVLPTWFQPAEPLVEMWRAIGARVQVTAAPGPVEPDAFDDASMWLTGWTADYPDPDGFFRGLLTSHGPFYRDDEILELLEQGRSAQDQGERMRAYHEVDRLWVAEHAAILPLAYPRSALLRRPWVEGLWASPLSRAHLDAVVVRKREEVA